MIMETDVIRNQMIMETVFSEVLSFVDNPLIFPERVSMRILQNVRSYSDNQKTLK